MSHPSKRISQQELESYLWGAAVLLRGLIDAGDYMCIPVVLTPSSSDSARPCWRF